MTCQRAMLTPFGPVQSCTLVAASPAGRQGRAAHRSVVTGECDYLTGWLPADNNTLHQGSAWDAAGRWYGVVIAGTGLSTAFGPGAFGKQLGPNNTARFGWWNLFTDRFNPTSGWFAEWSGNAGPPTCA
jgi:hypothetical protein